MKEASLNSVSPILVNAKRHQTRSRIHRWCSGRGRSCWRHPPYRRSAAPGGRAGGRYLAEKVCPQVCQVLGGQDQVIRVARSHSKSSKESQSQEKKLAEITHALPLHDQKKTVGTRADLIDHGRLQVDLRNSKQKRIAYKQYPLLNKNTHTHEPQER